MHFSYTPKGVCSRKIDLELENGVVTALSFTGGCHGNLQGISVLVAGHGRPRGHPPPEGHRLQGKGHLLPGSAGQEGWRRSWQTVRGQDYEDRIGHRPV